MGECVFCAIANGHRQSWVVDEDEWTISFLDTSQVTVGHTLVVPRHHAADIWDITVEDMQKVAVAVHRVAGLLLARLNPAGLTLFQANRSAGWQDVFHLHVHVVPRYPGDSLVLPWRVTVSSPDEMHQPLAKILQSG